MAQTGEKIKFIPAEFFDDDFNPEDKSRIPVVDPQDLPDEISSSGDEDEVPPKDEK